MSSSDLSAGAHELLTHALGNGYVIEKVTPLAGGHSARVRTRHGAFFVKLRDAAGAPMFAAEAISLNALSGCSSLRVPKVIAHASNDSSTILVLEWLQMNSLSGKEDGIRMGQALADLHAIGGQNYGWAHANFIGNSRQPNDWHANWSQFFVRQRLAPQFAMASAKGFGGELQRNGEQLMERAAALFLDYRPQPSLLHGDLWHGNVGILDSGEPAVFDPACYYGDREADLAMTELFGGFPLSFYSAYRQAAPLDEAYERRKPFYNLYHILNHLNLFGRSYLREAERVAAGLSSALRR